MVRHGTLTLDLQAIVPMRCGSTATAVGCMERPGGGGGGRMPGASPAQHLQGSPELPGECVWTSKPAKALNVRILQHPFGVIECCKRPGGGAQGLGSLLDCESLEVKCTRIHWSKWILVMCELKLVPNPSPGAASC